MNDKMVDIASRLVGEQVLRVRSTGNSSMNNVFRCSLADGFALLKQNQSPSHKEALQAEAEGLKKLRRQLPNNLPKVFGLRTEKNASYLAMEWVEARAPMPQDEEELGRSLARLHSTRFERFGWATKNFIGNSPQTNRLDDNWPSFFAECRIEPQVRMLQSSGQLPSGLASSIKTLVAKLPSLLSHDPFPSLVHGDLWSGNALFGAVNQEQPKPYLIDPSVHFADREVDLAMTELFGGFGRRFYSAYRESLPLEDGYDDRKSIYNLYHLLNHANLFGASYLGQVEGVLRRFV